MSGNRRRTVGMLVLGSCIYAWPGVAEARTPLPAVEVVQPDPPPRVRLLDVRGPIDFGWGYSHMWRKPVYVAGFGVDVSFIELSPTTHLHAHFGEHALIAAPVPRDRKQRTSLLGADAGLGISRYAAGGPAFSVTISAGPRWTFERDDVVPDGVGIAGRADVYPFYLAMPELTETSRGHRGWFGKYVASGLHVWVQGRYDALTTGRGVSYAAGVGVDFARTLLAPILMRKRSG